MCYLNPSYNMYVVQKGVALSVIAKAYDVTVDDIRKANNLNGVMLQPGQRLIILEDELLYDLVQNQIFDPNLKECRESILKQMSEA